MDPCIPTAGGDSSSVVIIAAVLVLVGIVVLLIGRTKPTALLLVALIGASGAVAAQSSTTSAACTPATTTTTILVTTTTAAPAAPVAVTETVALQADITGSLVDDGDTLGAPTATIIDLIAVQGPGAFAFGTPTALDDTGGRPCGTITVAADGSYSFAPALPGPHECTVQYTLTNSSGSSTATEIFQVF